MTAINKRNLPTSFGSGIFASCRGITKVDITLESGGIGNAMFYDCTALTDVTIKGFSTWIQGSMHTYAGGTTTGSVLPFDGCDLLTEINLPDATFTPGIENKLKTDQTGMKLVCSGSTILYWNANTGKWQTTRP